MSSFSDLVKEVNEEKKKKREAGITEEKQETAFGSLVKQANSEISKSTTKMSSTDVGNWFTSVSDVVNRASSHLSTDGYRAKDTSLTEEIEKYLSEATDVSHFLRVNKSYLKDFDSTYNSYVSAVSTLTNLRNSVQSSNRYFSQFENAEDYDTQRSGWLNPEAETNSETVALRKDKYQSNKSRIAEIESELKTMGFSSWVEYGTEKGKKRKALNEEKEALEAENRRYENSQKTLDDNYVPITDDVKRIASANNYTNASKEELWNYDMSMIEGSTALSNGGYVDEEGNIRDYKGNIVQYGNAPEVQDKLGMFLAAVKDGTMSNYVAELSATNGNYTNTWANLMQEGDVNGWRFLEEDEITIYYYKYYTEGQASAYKFLEDMTTELTRRETQKRADDIADASFLEQIALNAASIPMNVFGGAIGFVDDISNLVQGKDINPYSRAHMLSNDASAIRTDTATDINKATGNASLPWMDTTWGDVYQFLMSAGDSVVGVAMGGNAYGVLTGMGAASAEMKDLFERGASAEQIIAGGILAGAAEMVFEKFSIDALIKMGDSKTRADVIKNLLKQGGIEASEEMFTEIANTVSDAIVMGSQSDWVDVGTFVKSVLNAGLGGFISGGALGGAFSSISKIAYDSGVKKEGKSIIDRVGGVDSLQALAMDMAGVNQNEQGQTIANLSGKVSQKASAKNVGKLSEYMKDTITEQNRTDIQSALEKKGLNETEASRVADYLYKASTGYEFSKTEAAEVEGNDKIIEVLRDVVGDPNSTINERTRNLITAQLGIYTPKNTKANAVTENPTSNENATEPKFEVSESGKTTYNGNEVKIKDVASIKDGEVMLLLDNGETVNARDVEFGSEEEGLIYEAVVDMDIDRARDFVQGFNAYRNAPLATPQTASDYRLGFNESYTYGRLGITEEVLERDGQFSKSLNSGQRKIAYNRGRIDAESSVKADQAKLDEAMSNAKPKKSKANGRVIYDKGIRGTLSDEGIRAESLKLLEFFNVHFTHAKVRIFASYTDEVGRRVFKDADGKVKLAPNGMYLPDGSMAIDLNAGQMGQGQILYTFSHELTHMAKRLSPEKYKAYADFLLKHYGENHSIEALIAEERDNARKKGRYLSLEDAYDEAVARLSERMLVDVLNGTAQNKLTELNTKHKDIFEKIKEFFAKLVERIKNLYKDMPSDSASANIVHEMQDIAEQLQNMWLDMVVDAGKVNSTLGGDVASSLIFAGETYSEVRNALGKGSAIKVNENGEFTVGQNKEGTVLYNDRTYAEGGRETLKATLKAEGFSDEDIKAALVIMDAKHDLVKRLGKKYSAQGTVNKATIITDIKNGNSVLSALVKNGDYPVNIDLLTICKKRQAYQKVITRLCETGLIKQATLDSLAIAEINKILGKYGYETACLGCFVESKRLRIQEYAQTICDEWNSLVDKKVGNGNAKEFGFAKNTFVKDLTDAEVQRLTEEYEKAVTKEGTVNVGVGSYAKKFEKLMDSVPALRKHLSISDIATPQGMANLKSVSPELFALVASRYGSGTPKPVQDFNPYNSELAKYGSKPKGYSSLREYLYAIGGARMQSFSDFIIENWFDYCQIVADLSARKLPMHTYTKEISLVKLFGLTGIKINMSLIPDIDRSLGKEYAGLTKNAKGEYELIFADKDRFKATGGKSYMQSINFADAIALQNDPRYSSNIGTIAIGISDEQIRMMLDDSRIRMIIPYHSSSINPIFADLAGIEYYKDYTDVQSTVIKEIYDDKGNIVQLDLTKDQKDRWASGFEFNEALQRLGDARATAQAYLDWCADASKHTMVINGKTYTAVLTPKFEAFSKHQNYYKLLEDFNAYDCITEQAAQQGDVQQIYPENFEDILRDELSYQENYRNKQDPKWESAMGEIEAYLKKHTKAETVAYADERGIKLSKKERGGIPKPRKSRVQLSDRILMGSLFSGGGTLEAGLAYQMLDKQFGVEYDGKIASVYADNHGDHIQVGRVEDFDISKYDDIFYLHASPVCHNFSKAKHGAKELQMDVDSAKATAKHLETAMPQVFTVENAPGYRKSQSLKIITDKLTELGYKWDVDVYNSADYGSATSRNRVILRAVKDGELPAKPTKQERTNSWDKATRDLWDTLPKSYLRPSFISAIENTPKLPILDANGKVNVNKPLLILTTTSGHMVTYCWEGEICPTLTTKCGEAKLVMPDGNIYAVTPEFMGRIQGLPDDYKYPKAKTRAFTIIGNGIPTHLTKAVVGGVLDSAYEQTHDGKVLYSDRNTAFPDADIKYSLRTEAPPKKTVEVYKLMRLKDGKIYPLFIDSTEPLEVGAWYDADSPNLEFLKKLPSGIFLIDTENESYTTFAEYLAESGEKKTKFPSKRAIEEAASNGLRWVYIEDTAKGQKRFGGETRKYWNLGINGSGAVSTFSMRPGYHAGSLPTMRQIGKGANKDLRDDSFVWTIGEVPADINYQAEADRNPDKDIPTHIPVNGYYLKATNADKAKSQADVMGWYVAGSYKINRVISDSEARQIIDDWNAEHPDAQALYDYDRESGMDFDADLMKLVPRENTKYSEREIQPITNAEYDTLKKHFGVTGNFRVAGYLLPDGKLLDFSGKHWGDTTSRMRQVDHRDVQEVLNRGNNGINDMIDMIGSGSIRLMPETGGINLAVYPNEQQRRVLSVYINYMLNTEEQIIIDYDAVGGDTVYSKEYGKTATSRQILNDIRNYFNGARQSDLMKFHTMYSDRNSNSVSNRSLLANALESVAQNDIERNKLAQYKEKIALIEAEQKKLAEIRAKLAELYRMKGKRSIENREQINELNAEATITANRINTYDRQLLNLESTKALKGVLEREKQIAYKRAEQKGREALKAQREKDAETQRELMNRYQASRKKGIEGRKKTEMRRKIRKLIKDLNHILNHGTKERNVKEDMKDTVASAITLAEVLFNDDIKNEDIVRLGVESVTPEESKLLTEYKVILDRIDAINDQIAGLEKEELPKEERFKLLDDLEQAKGKMKNKLGGLNKKLENVFVRERARLNKAMIADVMDSLISNYSALKTSGDDYIKNAHSDAMEEWLKTLKKDLGGTTVRDMSITQLQSVYDAFKMVMHMVRVSNSLFREGRSEDLMTIVSAVQGEILSLYTNKEDPIYAVESKKNIIDTFSWNNLKPVYAFDRLGSATFQQLFWDAVKADDDFARLITDAGNFLQEQRDACGYADWDLSKATEFKLADGKVFKLTLEDMMSIYAYSKREQAYEHMVDGGFVFDENNTYTEKPFDGKKLLGMLSIKKKHARLTETYRVDLQLIAKVISTLSAEQKAYVDKMQAYMSAMGEKGNVVSRTLYGIDLFTEKYYIPLQSSKEYLNSNKQALDKTQTQVSLKNNGTTKPTTPGANNPIVLRAFDELWLEHIDTMSKYCAYVLPIENLTRVFNNVSRLEGESPMSTQALISAVYGNGARAYFDQYITDLNGGNNIGGYQSPLMTMFSRFKGTAVSASLSVVVQQPFAIIRAMAMIRPDYFVPFLRMQPNTKEADSTWEEIKKYAPIAILKEMGGFDIGSSGTTKDYIGITEYKGVKGKLKGMAKDSKYRKKFFDDVLMFGASKADELGWGIIWKAVKKEVATEQKLTPGTAKFFEAVGKRFTEVIVRTQVYDSVNSRSGLMRSKNDLNKFATSFAGEPTTVFNMLFNAGLQVTRAFKSKDKALQKKHVGQLARTSGVVLASIVLTSLAKSAIYANRDDDDDESWVERWMKNFGDSLSSDLNPLTMIPYVRDLVSIYEGWDVERPDMTLFAKVITSAKRCLEEGATKEEILDFSGDLANVFGIPVKNIVREVKGIINLIGDHFDDIETTDAWGGFVSGWTGEEQSKTDALYEAIINGDSGRVEHYKSSYKTDTAYHSALRKALRENDPRIKGAAEASYNGDVAEYSRIFNEILDEGCFELVDIKAAIEAEIKELEPDDDTAAEDTDKVESRYELEHFYSALISGNRGLADTIKNDLINTAVANGKEHEDAEKSFESSFRNYVGKKYKGGEISHSQASSMLTEYGGYDSNETYWELKEWDFKMANGDDAEYSKYTDFYEAVRTGKNIKAVISEYTSHGVDKETLGRQITSYYKPLYIAMSNSERASIKGYLLNAYVLLGYDRTKKAKDIDKWLEG